MAYVVPKQDFDVEIVMFFFVQFMRSGAEMDEGDVSPVHEDMPPNAYFVIYFFVWRINDWDRKSQTCL